MEYGLKNLTPDIRRLNDMKNVLYDQKWTETAPNFELYYMYRGVEKNNELRHDITIIPAKMLGSEFVKTKGHYHLESWQEIYTVLEGTAIYLMQKRKSGNEIGDAYFIETKKGESIIIPPGYGHVTINPAKTQELKMANWISENCKVDYLPYEKMQGGCYYYTKNGWLKNKNHKSVPELRSEEPLKSVPQDLDFLKQG